MPPGTVKVDRSTPFGNPFAVGEENGLGWGTVRDAEHAVYLFRLWLSLPARSIAYEVERHRELLTRLPALAGKDLACWCVAGASCHADVLLQLANTANIDAAVEALLDLDAPIPRTPLEDTVAAAQILRATGREPSDAEHLASALVALRRKAEASGATS